MDVEDIQTQECSNCDCNVRTRNNDVSNKLGQNSGVDRLPDDDDEEEMQVNDSRVLGWPNSSRIVRVSRASGGKDRHSKVWTSKGLRDRRVRLSVSTAIQFYDLQDRLGYDQPSKAVDWLIKKAADSIAELPSLNSPFHEEAIMEIGNGDQNFRQRTPQARLVRACSSSTSETSKGSSLSLSRSEGRVKARERARERATKEKEKENPISQNSASFTELLTTGVATSSAQDNNMFGLIGAPSSLGQIQMPQPMEIPYFTLSGYDRHHHQQQQQQHFSFMPENISPVTARNGSDYNNLNFTISSASSDLAAGFNNHRGTLQSNLLLPHHQHHLQRFSPIDDGPNLPFLMSTTESSSSMENQQNHQFSNGFDARLQLYYDDSDQKGKRKS